MALEFSCDGTNMEKVLEELKSARESIDKAHQQAIKVQKEIDQKTCWTGESQKALSTFLNLLIQYHEDFAKGGSGAVPKGIDELENLQKNLSCFYDDWNEYQDLERMV